MCKNKVQFQAGYSLIEFFKIMEQKANIPKHCLNGAGRGDLSAMDVTTNFH
jgi:hypothetical protein